MRCPFGVLVLLLLPVAVLPAQSAGHRWGVDLVLTRDAFTGASADTGGTLEVSPAPRVAYELGLSRRTESWGLRLSISVATGGLRGKGDDFRLDDNTSGVDRYRVGLLLERALATGPQLRLSAVLGPTLDRWESEGINDRTVLGARGGLNLGIRVGRFSVEELALVGLSGSPFEQEGVGPAGEVRSLWTWSVGLGARFGL